jgi:hypothetical protein
MSEKQPEYNANGGGDQPGAIPAIDWPGWAYRLVRRLRGLHPGVRYLITFTASRDKPDWTIKRAGKVEK